MAYFDWHGKQVYINDLLKENLDTAKQALKKDFDIVILVDGSEGTGKSLNAQQIAAFMDPTFDIDRIAFTWKTFETIAKQERNSKAVIFDEAFRGLSSREATSYINKRLVNLLAEVRQNNLVLIIVMPTFFELDKYPALHRSICLIHVYMRPGFKRGYFKFYSAKKKRLLYLQGKKLMSYKKPQPNFQGNFTNTYTVDEQEYRRRKREAFNQSGKKKTQQQELNQQTKKWIDQRNALAKILKTTTRLSIPRLLKLLNANLPENNQTRDHSLFENAQETKIPPEIASYLGQPPPKPTLTYNTLRAQELPKAAKDSPFFRKKQKNQNTAENNIKTAEQQNINTTSPTEQQWTTDQ